VELESGDMFIYSGADYYSADHYSKDQIQSAQGFELDLAGGQTIGIRLDTANRQLVVENSAESIGAVDFAVTNDVDDPMDDNYYTAFPGETVMVNWEQTGYDEFDIIEEFNQKLEVLPNGISPTTEEQPNGREVG